MSKNLAKKIYEIVNSNLGRFDEYKKLKILKKIYKISEKSSYQFGKEYDCPECKAKKTMFLIKAVCLDSRSNLDGTTYLVDRTFQCAFCGAIFKKTINEKEDNSFRSFSQPE